MKKKRNISPEERQRRSDRMKARWEEKRAVEPDTFEFQKQMRPIKTLRGIPEVRIIW